MSWKSSKQDTIADSTIESDYITTSEVAKEVVWIIYFISELGVVPSASSPIVTIVEPQCKQRSLGHTKSPYR
jgi:hypothetical protein